MEQDQPKMYDDELSYAITGESVPQLQFNDVMKVKAVGAVLSYD